MKMSDIFKLPMVCEDGNGFVYSKDLRHSIQFDNSDTHMMDHKKAVTHAINNHDRMTDEIAELREALQAMVDFAEHQMNPWQNDPSIFTDEDLGDLSNAKKLLNK